MIHTAALTIIHFTQELSSSKSNAIRVDNQDCKEDRSQFRAAMQSALALRATK